MNVYELDKIIMIWDECEWEGKLWVTNDVYECGRVVINWLGRSHIRKDEYEWGRVIMNRERRA